MNRSEDTLMTPGKRKIRKPVLLAVVVLLVLFVSLVSRDLPYRNIENDQLQAMLESGVPLYDVRRPDEWRQTGVIEGSQLLTFVDTNGRVKKDFLQRFTAEVGKDDHVILICRTGNRTSQLSRYLVEELGYSNVFNVDDGISRWIREDRPVKKVMTQTAETPHSRGVI